VERNRSSKKELLTREATMGESNLRKRLVGYWQDERVEKREEMLLGIKFLSNDRQGVYPGGVKRKKTGEYIGEMDKIYTHGRVEYRHRNDEKSARRMDLTLDNGDTRRNGNTEQKKRATTQKKGGYAKRAAKETKARTRFIRAQQKSMGEGETGSLVIIKSPGEELHGEVTRQNKELPP